MSAVPAAGATPSCLDCPSYVTASESIGVFGKSSGAPMCKRFGRVLGTPRMRPAELQAVAERQAETCSEFGAPRPAVAGTSFVVGIPDPDAREELPDLDRLKQGCRACGMCQNFIPDDKVEEKFGFTTGLCAAKAKLIFPSKRVEEANGCRFRKIGTVRQTAEGINLLPLFTVSVGGSTAAALSDDFARSPDSVIDPSVYTTDKEVTPEEAEGGVRAWRKIVDPEGTGNFVFMPIFDPKFFPEEEQAKIPQTGDDEHPELYLDHNGSVYKIMVLWRELDETPMAWGMPGVGKTEIFRHIAWLMQLPFYRISITGSTELDDLAGKMMFDKEKGTYFHHGRVSSAWTKPCIMVVDEPNTGQPEVWEFIRPMTDNSKQLVLDMSDNPTPLDRHAECHLGLAANPAWNALNVGTNVIGDADASRLMHLEFDLPPEHIERAIVKNRVRIDGWEIDEARLNFLMDVAGNIRDLCKDNILSMTWGIRPQLKVARTLAWFDPVTAYRMAVADMMEPQQQQALLDQVRAQIPPTKFPPIKRVVEEGEDS